MINASGDDPAEFYTGLVAQLYEPLAGGISDSNRFIEFVRSHGEPALEVCCGTGLPLLDLVEAGLYVEGLDSSEDMLMLCRQKAASRGLTVNLHHGLMQKFDTARRYQSIYIANGSITLLGDDDELRSTLLTIRRHLVKSGTLLIDLDVPDANRMRPFIGQFKETTQEGSLLKVGMTNLEVSDDNRNLAVTLRYERVNADGTSDGHPETVERVWHRRVWSLKQFSALLEAGNFSVIDTRQLEGGIIQILATPD